MRDFHLIPIVALLALSACGSNAGGQRKVEPPLVRASGVATARFVDRIDAVGTARANEQVTLAAPVTERIERLNFDDGGYVTRGQIIAVLARGQESAQLEEARARAQEARQQLVRLESLKARGFATNSALDTQTALAAQARAQAASASASIGDRVIRAPFSGWVSLRNISAGAVVQAGTEIAQISDISRIKLDFPVPETLLAQVRAGQPITAIAAAYPDTPFRGTIASVDPVTQPRDPCGDGTRDPAQRRSPAEARNAADRTDRSDRAYRARRSRTGGDRRGRGQFRVHGRWRCRATHAYHDGPAAGRGGRGDGRIEARSADRHGGRREADGRAAGASGGNRGRAGRRPLMQLSDISVRRPVFAAVLAILLSLVGLVAFFGLPVREYPDTDPPVVSVSTEYVGAAASVIEARVTQPIEEQLSGIEGIDVISSRSRDGGSDISIEFRPGRDIDAAANDVRDRVGSVLGELPEEVLPPEVRKVDADAQPILFLVVSRPGWSRLQLSDYVDRNLVDRFATIDGVARVFVGGEARPSMRVWLDANRLAAFRLTPGDVETALRNQNVELPAGRIESASQNVTLRVDRNFSSPESFRGLVVGRGPDGYLVRLGDIARIETGAENPYTTFRLNGGSAVGHGYHPPVGGEHAGGRRYRKGTGRRIAADPAARG